VVSYTWAMRREVIDDPAFSLTAATPAAVYRSGMTDRPVERRHDVFKLHMYLEFLRHHRRAGRAGQRLGRQARAARAELAGGATSNLRLRRRDDNPDLRTTTARPPRPTPTRRSGSGPHGVPSNRRRGQRGGSPRAHTWCRPNTLPDSTRTGYWLVDNVGRLSTRSAARFRIRPSTMPSGGSGRGHISSDYGVEVDGQELGLSPRGGGGGVPCSGGGGGFVWGGEDACAPAPESIGMSDRGAAPS